MMLCDVNYASAGARNELRNGLSQSELAGYDKRMISNSNLASGYKDQPLETALNAVFKAVEAACDKKAQDSVILDVRNLTHLTDYFLITSGQTPSQVRAIVSAIESQLATLGFRPEAIEGKQEGRWVLIDYGDFIVHVLHERERNFYKLEQFWHRAAVINRKMWAQD